MLADADQAKDATQAAMAKLFFHASDFSSRTCAVVHARLFDPFFMSASIS